MPPYPSSRFLVLKVLYCHHKIFDLLPPPRSGRDVMSTDLQGIGLSPKWLRTNSEFDKTNSNSRVLNPNFPFSDFSLLHFVVVAVAVVVVAAAVVVDQHFDFLRTQMTEKKHWVRADNGSNSLGK